LDDVREKGFKKKSVIKAEEYIICKNSIGQNFGHAPAKFAQRVGTLSEKLPYSRFPQVPADSDYPCIEAVLQESKFSNLF